MKRSGLPLAMAGPSDPALHGHAMAVCGDILYIYGGLIWREKGSIGSLLAYHLLEDRWEVLHNKHDLSHEYPEGRDHHQMWVQAGRLFILGGRTPCE